MPLRWGSLVGLVVGLMLLGGGAEAEESRSSSSAGRGARAEADLHRLYTAHFILCYAEGVSHREANRLADRLELVYEAVGQRFAYFPREPFAVVLYPAWRFHAATVSPGWATALFDGTIRLQLGEQQPLADSALIHEYVHAVVHRITRGRVPAWLSEGLALSLDGAPRPAGSVTRPPLPLTRLHVDLTGLPTPLARAAYQASYDATRRLIARYGLRQVRALLGKLPETATFADAFELVLGERYADFERGWLAEQGQ